MLYNTQHLYFILPLRVLCSASLLPNSRPGCPVPGISVAEESPPVSCTREFRERDSFLSPLSSFTRHRMPASLCRVRRTSELRILRPLRRD